ncbi:MAG: hypothetical protein Q9191_000754 [Dirinaria sp. TL-2023a]
MCIWHYTFHSACGHYTLNLDRTVNSHCTPLQSLLHRYHDQEEANRRRNMPFPPPIPIPQACPPVFPATTLPLRALTAHPSLAAERRAYEGWSRFSDREEANPFFLRASLGAEEGQEGDGIFFLPSGQRHLTSSTTEEDEDEDQEPTLPQLATIFARPSLYLAPPNPEQGGAADPNVQITRVGFGCGGISGCRGSTCGLGREGFSIAELERAIEEEDHRGVGEMVAEIRRAEERADEVVMVGRRAVLRRYLPLAEAAIRDAVLRGEVSDDGGEEEGLSSDGETVVVHSLDEGELEEEEKVVLDWAEGEVTHTPSGRRILDGSLEYWDSVLESRLMRRRRSF